ncbi:unnamed protein product [Symbiodinium sp. CCMP2592]|nr:unnamed protein product [Symbiodinium sp. CCMP2592]
MATFAELQTKIQAVQTFLDSQKPDLDEKQFLSVKATQLSQVMQDIVAFTTLTAEQATSLSTVLRAGPWSVEDRAAVAGTMSNIIAHNPTRSIVRRPNQDVACFSTFLSRQDIEILKDASCSLHCKADQIATRLVRIQLWLPSEQAWAEVIKTAKAAGLTFEGARGQYDFLPLVKKHLKAKSKRLPKIPLPTPFPSTWQALVLSPSILDVRTFQQDLPQAVREEAYSEADPPVVVESALILRQDAVVRKSSLELRSEGSGMEMQVSKRAKASMTASGQQQDVFGNMAQQVATQLASVMMTMFQGSGASGSQGSGDIPGFQMLKPPKSKDEKKDGILLTGAHLQSHDTPDKNRQMEMTGPDSQELPQADETRQHPQQSPQTQRALQATFEMPDTSVPTNKIPENSPMDVLHAATVVENAVTNRQDGVRMKEDEEPPQDKTVMKKPAAAKAKAKSQPKSKAKAKPEPKSMAKSKAKATASPKSEAQGKLITTGPNKGWRVQVRTRGGGESAGQTDKYYYSPDGGRFRSRGEAQKYGWIILELLPEEDDEAAPSRSTLKRKRDLKLNLSTPYGPLWRELTGFEMAQGPPLKVTYLDPVALLWSACQQGGGFQNFLQTRAARCPCSPAHPWDLCLYVDEVSPGNQLKPLNERKLQVVYFSLKQLGGLALSKEDAWFVLTAVRSIDVKRLSNGMTQLMKRIFAIFLLERREKMLHGISLPMPNSQHWMLCLLIADEAALKSVWEDKGASGTKLCFMCQNVVAHSSSLHCCDATGTLVSHVCHNKGQMVRHTDETILEAAVHLADNKPRMNKGEFKMRQFALGLNYAEHGPLFSAELRPHLKPIAVSMYDWMHNFVVGGIFQVEMTELLKVLRSQGIPQTELHHFLSDCNWPSAVGDKGASAKKVFAKTLTEFKSGASECMALYPAMRAFLQEKLPLIRDNDAKECCRCFFILCEVLDQLYKTATPGDVANLATTLEHKVSSHLELFKACYGEDYVLPKHHMNMHLGDLLRRHSVLLSCFVHERRHKEIKRYANNLDSMQTGSEKHVLQLELEQHLKDLKEFSEKRAGLINGKAAPELVQSAFSSFFGLPACAGLQVSMKCYVGSGRLCKREDVVVVSEPNGDEVAQVWFHVVFNGNHYTCMSVWRALGRNRFDICQEPVFRPTAHISRLCMFKKEGDRALVIPLSMPM